MDSTTKSPPAPPVGIEASEAEPGVLEGHDNHPDRRAEPRWRSVPVVGSLLWLAAVAVAYRSLWLLDPTKGLRFIKPDSEGFLFAAQATSPPLIFALSLWLLWRRYARIERAFAAGGSVVGGTFLLGMAWALAAWSHSVGAPQLLIPSLSLALLGTGLWGGGWAGGRAVLLPALFVLFAAPLPAVMANQVVFPLQLFAGPAASTLTDLLGIDATVHGDLIATGTNLFQVIETCSGLRTIMTLAMAAVLYGEGFGKTAGRTALLVAVSPVLALLTNAVRVASIVANPVSEFAEVHTLQGMVTIFCGVLLLGVVDAAASAIGRLAGPPRRAAPAQTATAAWAAAPVPWTRYGVPALVVLSIALATPALPAWKPPKKSQQEALWKLPRALPPSRDLTVDREFLGSVSFDYRFVRRFEWQQTNVDLFVGADERRDGRVSGLSPKTLYPKRGFRIRELGRIRLEPDGPDVERAVLDGRTETVVVYHWRVGVGSTGSEALRGWLELDRSPLRRPYRAAVVRLTTRVPRLPSGLAESEERIRAFLESIRPVLDEFELL